MQQEFQDTKTTICHFSTKKFLCIVNSFQVLPYLFLRFILSDLSLNSGYHNNNNDSYKALFSKAKQS